MKEVSIETSIPLKALVGSFERKIGKAGYVVVSIARDRRPEFEKMAYDIIQAKGETFLIFFVEERKDRAFVHLIGRLTDELIRKIESGLGEDESIFSSEIGEEDERHLDD